MVIIYKHRLFYISGELAPKPNSSCRSWGGGWVTVINRPAIGMSSEGTQSHRHNLGGSGRRYMNWQPGSKRSTEGGLWWAVVEEEADAWEGGSSQAGGRRCRGLARNKPPGWLSRAHLMACQSLDQTEPSHLLEVLPKSSNSSRVPRDPTHQSTGEQNASAESAHSFAYGWHAWRALGTQAGPALKFTMTQRS